MMKNIFQSIAVVFFSFLSMPIFAQLAEPGDDPDAPAPIDDFVWVLFLIALIYVFIICKIHSNQKNVKL